MNAAVWHEWKWGWNAGGWGSKSYFEVTCGVMNAMEVCRSSAISCLSFTSPPESELAPPVPTMSQKHQQHRHPHAVQRDVGQHAPSPATSPPGRRVHAGRNHPAEKTQCLSTPIGRASRHADTGENLSAGQPVLPAVLPPVPRRHAAAPSRRPCRADFMRFSCVHELQKNGRTPDGPAPSAAGAATLEV